MLIFKQPRIGGAVPPHQDSTFLYTSPTSATGLWIPLEDCTEANGCLYFYPKSHKFAPISRRFKRIRNSAGVTEATEIVGEEYPAELADPKHYIPVVIPAGTLVLIHGSALHKSGPNTSDKSRLAYTFHMIEGEAEYSKDNWLQPGSSSFVRLY
ncbi:hypothetical protein DSO57_1032401 [Entomophthora muscae]|uniref:Uncharacterized protein n=1 Tax=Entomophthora muscae TaxID=34485 RepID=A0ACC2RRF6_9FUNG|nr:hypothetical protein DSO57_1032401 [Entomophthora muscae]